MLIFGHGGVGAVGGIGGPKMGYVEEARENHVKKKVEEGDSPSLSLDLIERMQSFFTRTIFYKSVLD